MGRRVFAAFIRMGSPSGLMVSVVDGNCAVEGGVDGAREMVSVVDGDGVVEGGVDGAKAATSKCATGGMEEEGVEQTKGSVLIEGGGMACLL